MDKLVVIGGANGVARGVIRKFINQGCKEVKIIDFKPFRKSVYDFQRSLPEGIKLEKEMVHTTASLDGAMEGASHVFYCSHDYFAMAPSKFGFLDSTA